MANRAASAGRRPGERLSRFSVTCGLLSQFLKKKVNLGDLSLGMAPTPLALDGRGTPEYSPRTMNLLPGVETSGGDGKDGGDEDAVAEQKDPVSPEDVFSQHAASFAPLPGRKPYLARGKQAAQMTMFYGGKVVVFDNLPADKATELMGMAGRDSPAAVQNMQATLQLKRRIRLPPSQRNSSTTNSASNSETKPVAATATAAAPTQAVVALEALLQKPPQPAASGLLIARRVPLNRFLGKRKDRISATAPYQAKGGTSTSSSPSPAKQEDSQRWLALAQQYSQ